MISHAIQTMLLNATLAADPSQHVYDHPFKIGHDGRWMWSGNMGNLVLSGIILIVVGLYVASRVKTGPESQGTDRYVTKGRFAHMIEVICVYMRDDVVKPLLHDRTNKYMPILWTFFFFILVNNLLGLLPIMDVVHLINKDWAEAHITPIGGTATQNIWVTGALAILACIVFNIAAIARLGIGGYLKHLTGGAPLIVAPLIFVLEFAGQILIKPIALALRLFANMTAGHILLATLLGFFSIWNVESVGAPIKGGVSVIAFFAAMAIFFLELFVAFLQAFIFTFLVAVFISLMDHHDDHSHEHSEHGHDHGHAHAHGHEHAHA